MPIYPDGQQRYLTANGVLFALLFGVAQQDRVAELHENQHNSNAR